MTITPDAIVLWQWGWAKLNLTLVFTWVVMVLLATGSWLITRRLERGAEISRWQNLLEVIVEAIRGQIREISHRSPDRYLPFVGTLFLFIATSNLLAVIPGFMPPTGSLSTTAALAACVFIGVPIFGLEARGVGGYLRQYIRPTVFMLPFNVIGELSRTLALAVRLYGNMMSGTVIVGILLSLTPFFFPIVMQLLGLLTGMIQAYIFAVLAMVYIASATTVHWQESSEDTSEQSGSD